MKRNPYNLPNLASSIFEWGHFRRVRGGGQEVEDDDDEEKEEEEEERSGSIDSGYCLTAYFHLICPLGDSQPGPLERKLQNTLANL